MNLTESKHVAYLMAFAAGALEHAQHVEDDEPGILTHKFSPETTEGLKGALAGAMAELEAFGAYLAKENDPRWDGYFRAAMTGLLASSKGDLDADACAEITKTAAYFATLGCVERHNLITGKE